MNKKIFVVLFSLLMNNCYAQNEEKVKIQNGIDKFILGSTKSMYETSIRLVEGGTMTWNSKTTYSYLYTPFITTPFGLMDIKFSNLILTFDEKDTLVEISFSKVYSKLINGRGYSKEAKKDIKRLNNYFTSAWNKEGMEKMYSESKTNIDKRYEWYGMSTKMIFQVYTEPYKDVILSITLTKESN